MKKLILILIPIMLLLGSCGLRRTNPLDPFGDNNVVVPDPVTNITFFIQGGQGYKTVSFSWTANSGFNTDGYYLYRGLAYNSSFAVVDTVTTNSCVHGSDPWHVVLPGDYYYKISAWKTYGDRRLEGPISSHVFVRINP
ncbi:MAG: hypothetical protein CVU49_08635 [Candidatus Cloacimonetes bacterium HGW-Cloacimonetes-2]|jgi:hypothetical protein|nr:MAG: hypothetical protein CVU49_08635 [Candidatus Cloacimonetes bacterium HGW-Cloacimonetes-2]